MKLEDGRLTSSVACNRQNVAYHIIGISDGVTAACHGPDQATQFVIAIGDWPAENLLRNREQQSITLQAAIADNHSPS